MYVCMRFHRRISGRGVLGLRVWCVGLRIQAFRVYGFGFLGFKGFAF